MNEDKELKGTFSVVSDYGDRDTGFLV